MAEDISEDQEIVIVMKEVMSHPEFIQSKIIDGVTVTVQAEEGVLPEGTELEVTDVTEAVSKVLKEKAGSEGTKYRELLAYDINLMLNGKKCGEIGIDSAILSDMNIPIIMVSGDDKTCKEAQELIPNVVTAEVKKGTDRHGAMLLPPEKAKKVIYDKTVEAISKIGEIKPVVYDKPIEFTIELTVTNQIPQLIARPNMTVIDGRTYSVKAENAEDAWYRCWKKK